MAGLTNRKSNHMEKKKFFEITYVSLDDFESAGFDVSNVTDEQMEELARNMADVYLEDLFWTSMETIAKDFIGMPKTR